MSLESAYDIARRIHMKERATARGSMEVCKRVWVECSKVGMSILQPRVVLPRNDRPND